MELKDIKNRIKDEFKRFHLGFYKVKGSLSFSWLEQLVCLTRLHRDKPDCIL